MTLSVRSSSLHDTTSLQRLGMAGALAASVLVVGLAVQVSPLVGTRFTADDAAVSNTGYMAAPGIADPAGEHSGLGALSNTGYAAAVGVSDPAGEHIGLGAVSNTGYMSAVGISDPAGEHIGLGAVSNTGYAAAVGVSDPAGEHIGWQQVLSPAVDQAAIDKGRHGRGSTRQAEPPTRIGGR